MHIHVNGKNIEITDAIKAYVKRKLEKWLTTMTRLQALM